MKIFNYCLREYFKYVIGTIVLTVFLFILFDFIHKTTKYFAEFNPKTQDILAFYAFQIPGQIVQALPIASLLGGVISMILLSRTNEITAMRAIGLGPLQLAQPLIAGGTCLSIISIVLSEFAVPKYAQRIHFIQQVKIEGKKDDESSGGGRWLRDHERFIYFREYDPLNQEMQNVQVIEIGDNFRPVKSMEADRAVYNSDNKKWALQEIRIDKFLKSRTLDRSEFLSREFVDIPIEPKKMMKDARRPSELAIKELDELILRGEKSGVNTIPFKVDYQGKIAYPFAALVVSIIGLKFGYKSERSTETAKGVLLAFFIGISYWVILSAGRALGLRGDVDPIIAAWLPNFIVLAFIAIDGWFTQSH